MTPWRLMGLVLAFMILGVLLAGIDAKQRQRERFADRFRGVPLSQCYIWHDGYSTCKPVEYP